jgi:two-component system, cell cycle sensor histidine kinase and response regulator CckA
VEGNRLIESGGIAALQRERIFHESSMPMCIADSLGTVLAANPAFSRVIGSCVQRSLVSLFSDAAERDAAERVLRGLVEDHVPVVFRGRCHTVGRPSVLSWTCRIVDDVILAEVEDVAARVAVENQLEALLQALPDIYFRLDAEGRIVAFHAARVTEFHVPPERLIGQRPDDLVTPDVRPMIGAAVDRVRAERVSVRIEYSLPTPSGDDQFEAYLVPCGESEVTALIRNTTARHRAEAALRATEERLRASQKLDAIGRLAHDFNNLLGVILGRLTFLKRVVGLESAAREHVTEAFDAALHAASLTRQLLAFGRRQMMQPKVFDLNAVLATLHEMLSRVAGEHVEVLVVPSGFTCPIDSDPVQIEQVVLNLVLNARHAMPEGGRITISTGEVRLDQQEAVPLGMTPGTYVTLTVSDTGYGMPPEVMGHLFEPFFTTKAPGEGTGLGLASVYGIVKQSGGDAIVRSEAGAGTTFELRFPRAMEDQRMSEVTRRSSSSLRSARALGETVLVVEDASGMRELVVEILRRAGYEVLSAHDGEEAIRIVREEPERIALVVTDVVMPKMSGRTLARRIREIRADMRILLMSGYESASDAGRRDLADARLPLIEKPFTEGVLLARVRDVLEDVRSVPVAIPDPLDLQRR